MNGSNGCISNNVRRSRSLLLGVTVVSIVLASSVITLSGDEEEQRARAALLSAIRNDGYSGNVMTLRNDTELFLGMPPYAGRYDYYEARVGGMEKLDSGEMGVRIPAHPLRWRGMWDRQNKRLYRLYGFTSVDDFSDLVVGIGADSISQAMSFYLVERYLKYVHAWDVDIIENYHSAIGVLEREIGSANISERCADTIVSRARLGLRRLELDRSSLKRGNGYQIDLVLAGVGSGKESSLLTYQHARCIIDARIGFKLEMLKTLLSIEVDDTRCVD